MKQFSLNDIWQTVRGQWWIVGIFAFCAALLAGLYTLFVAEQEWNARTTVLFETPQGEISETMLDMQLLLGQTLSSSPHEHFETIIRSRRIMEKIIEQYDLIDRFEVEYPQEALEILQERCLISEKSSRSLALTVTMMGPPRLVATDEENRRDAALAADIANSIIEELKKFLSEAEYTRATKQRKFLAEQLDQTQQEMIALEDALVNYATRHDLVEPSSQAAAAIRNLETLRAREAELSSLLAGAREAEQAAMARIDSQEQMIVASVSEERNPRIDDLRSRILELRRELTQQTDVEGKSARHPDVQRLQAELDEAQRQLTDEVSNEMLTRTRQMQVDPSYTNLVTTAMTRSLEREALEAQLQTIRAEKNQAMSELSALPALSQEYERLQGQLQLKAEAVARLTERYEGARVAEAMSLDHITVLDEAIPPYKRSAPSLKKNVGAVGVAGFIIGVIFAFYRQGRIDERRRRGEAPETDRETTSDE